MYALGEQSIYIETIARGGRRAPNNQMQRTCRKGTHSAREEQNARLFATPLI
jgi:hypothetical protein